MPDGEGFGEFSGVCGTVGMSTKMTREKSVKKLKTDLLQRFIMGNVDTFSPFGSLTRTTLQ